MKNTSIPILLFTCACNYVMPDPCAEGSPLGAQLSDEEYASLCESGETGGQESDTHLACAHDSYPFSFCAAVDTTQEVFLAPDYFHTEDCGSTSLPFAHVDNWASPVSLNYAGRLDSWCAVEGQPGDGSGNTDADSHWRLCRNDSPTADIPQAFYPATISPGPISLWTDLATCADPNDLDVGQCDLGLVAIGDYQAGSPLSPTQPKEWTCSCYKDDHCPGSMVCEGGYYLEGMWPRPSLCTWTDGSGDSVAPGGPAAYGLDEWGDGITVDGDNIVLTPMFFIGIVQGVINDDHAFAIDGQLTECGVESLCAHVGMQVGDRLDLEQHHIDSLENGDVARIPVLRDGRSERTLSVRVE